VCQFLALSAYVESIFVFSRGWNTNYDKMEYSRYLIGKSIKTVSSGRPMPKTQHCYAELALVMGENKSYEQYISKIMPAMPGAR